MNSTGWFLPSGKELHLLYYMDVDNVCNKDGDNTMRKVNNSLMAIGVNELGVFPNWSSSESLYTNGETAFILPVHYEGDIYFLIVDWDKISEYKVRAVCAF